MQTFSENHKEKCLLCYNNGETIYKNASLRSVDTPKLYAMCVLIKPSVIYNIGERRKISGTD